MVDIGAIKAAAGALAGVADRTPLQLSRALSEIAGAEVYLKCENLQRGGSFKIRGSYTRMANLSEEQKRAGVLAASAGNHAQGVALAARMLSAPATIYMPEGAALPKLAATRNYGAEVRIFGTTVDEALAEAKREAERTGQVIIHPFDHEDIVTGQASVGVEIAEDLPQVKTVLVPTGGGGLLAGVGLAIRELLGPGVQVRGVQAAEAAAYPASIGAGHPVPLAAMHTMADGIAIASPGNIPLQLISELGLEIDTVSEESLSQALLILAERAKMVVEPSGGAGVADLLQREERLEGPIVVVLSGGNIDPLVLMKVLRHGMSAAGRFLQFQVRTKDTPGHLASLLELLANRGANVLDIAHVRTGASLAIDDVDIAVECETKGSDHCEVLLKALADQGFELLQERQ